MILSVKTSFRKPKISMSLGKSSASKIKIPKNLKPNIPSSQSLKSFDSSKFMGKTPIQKNVSSMFNSIKPKKIAVVKAKIAKLKLK